VLTRLKCPANCWTHAHYVEEVRAYERLPDALWFASCAHKIALSPRPARYCLEANVVVAQVAEIARGEGVAVRRIVGSLGESREAVEIRQGDGFPKQSVGNAEDRGAGSDPEPDGDHDRHGKSGRLAQDAAGIADIL